MSLLLEALKKAEKAKEEAQRRADAGAETERAQLALQAEAPAAEVVEKKPLMTRDQLPDISAPLEIVSDDLRPETPPESEPAPAAPRRNEGEARASEPQSASRASARKVFEVKFREPNPRLPFYIAMASLGAFAVGTVVYFYLQLRPPPPLVNANPPRPASEPAVPVAAMTPPTPGLPATSGEPPIPGLPGAAPAPRAAPAVPLAAAPAAPLAAAPAAPETPRLKPQPARVQRAPAASAPERAPQQAPVTPRAEPQVNPRVEAGYTAFLAGDAAAARKEYQQALADDPGNRDATLGLAALDIRAGRYELAEAAYLRLLGADPKDSAAQAGLISLRAGRLDPLVAESRLKSLVAADPASNALRFALGNQLAQQGRWAEAHQEYLKAASAEPDNPDYAYNLAVSFDHLRQPRRARDYYLRAVALADRRGASFDLAAARARAAQIEP